MRRGAQDLEYLERAVADEVKDVKKSPGEEGNPKKNPFKTTQTRACGGGALPPLAASGAQA